MRHRATHQKQRLPLHARPRLGRVIGSVDVAIGSFAEFTRNRRDVGLRKRTKIHRWRSGRYGSAFAYFRGEPGLRTAVNLITKDARRIAKMPVSLGAEAKPDVNLLVQRRQRRGRLSIKKRNPACLRAQGSSFYSVTKTRPERAGGLGDRVPSLTFINQQIKHPCHLSSRRSSANSAMLACNDFWNEQGAASIALLLWLFHCGHKGHEVGR
jgi:hypothetical protein